MSSFFKILFVFAALNIYSAGFSADESVDSFVDSQKSELYADNSTMDEEQASETPAVMPEESTGDSTEAAIVPASGSDEESSTGDEF